MASGGALGRLNVMLGLNSAEFTSGLNKAEYQAKKSLDQIAASARRVELAFAGMFGAVSVGAVFGRFINETIAAEQEQAQLAAVLKSTGQAAGLTQKQLNDMAGALSAVSTVSVGEINQAQTTLLAFTGIVGDQFKQALQAAIDMSARTGMSVVSATETIGRALDVPSKGLAALSRQGFRFTDDQKKLAEQLEATGRTAEAQQIVLSALHESYGGAAEAARNTLGGALKGLQNQIGELMTGDAGSVNGLTMAVNGLTDILASEQTKGAFGAVNTLIADMGSMTAKTADELAGLTRMFSVAKAGFDLFVAKGDEFNAKIYGSLNPWSDGTPADEMAKLSQAARDAEKAYEDSKSAFSSFDPNANIKRWNESMMLSAYSDVGETGGGVPELAPNIVKPSGTSTSSKSSKPKKAEDPLGVFMTEQNIDFAMQQYQSYLDFIDTSTGRAKARQIEQQKSWLDGALDLGQITYEEYAKAMDSIAEKGEQTMTQLDEFTLEAARNIQNSLGDGLYDLLSGNFDDIGKRFGEMITKMVADAAAANIAGALFGDYGKSGQIGGILGSLGGAIAGMFGGPITDAQATNLMQNNVDPRLFDGGGFTGAGGKYEPAGIVHKGEYVLTKEATSRIGVGVLDRMNRGYAAGGLGGRAPGVPAAPDGGVSVNIINNSSQPVTASQPKVSMDAMGRMVVEVMIADLQRNGPYSRQLKGRG